MLRLRKRKPADPWKKNRRHRWMPLPYVRLSEHNYVCRHCLTLVGIPTLSGVNAVELYGGKLVAWNDRNRQKVWRALQRANMRQAREEHKAIKAATADRTHGEIFARVSQEVRYQLDALRWRMHEDEQG